MTYSSSKTIANIAIKVFADSYATTKVLQSIYVSGTPTKSYYVGQSFSLGTAKVYARYTDQTTYPDEDISSHVTWTSLEHGTTSVTGTYAGKEVEITGLTVRDEGSVYKKVTSVNELIEGAKVVIGTSNGAYVACAQSTNNKNRKSEAAGGEYGYYDSGDVLNYSVNTTVFTIGITSYGFTFNDGTGYLYAGSNSENILRVETELDENHNGEWSITITDGIATITSLGSHTHNTINGNNDVFSAYQSPTVTVSLYADVAGTVQAFIDNYLHTEIAYNPDPTLPINNAGSCEDSDWYVDAKSVLVGLGSDYIEEFQGNDDFANALARYNAWAAACGDTTPFAGSGIVSARTSVLLGKIDNTATITLIVIISMVSVTAIGGYFFIRRRKAN